MKTLKNQFKFTSIVIIILSLLVFSCSKDNDTIQNPEGIEENNPKDLEGVVTDFSLSQGKFVKEFEINSDNSKYILEVSTNNKDIFKVISQDGITGEILQTDAAIQKLKTNNLNSNEAQISVKNSEEHFVNITTKILRKKDDEALIISFNDNLLNIMEEFNAKTMGTTVFQDTQKVERPGRYTHYAFYGDGTPTKVRLYYKYRDGRNRYYTTKNGFRNDFLFRVCYWPWADNTRCYYYAWEKISGRVANVGVFDRTWECKKCTPSS